MTAESLPPAELRAATLRGLRWTVIARPMVELVLLGSMVLLARLVSPAEFGRFAIASIAAQLVAIPGQGVDTALVQRPAASRDHLQAAAAIALLTGLALVGLTLVVATTVVGPVFGGRTAELVRLTTPACFLAAVTTVPSALLQRRLAFRRLALIDVAGTVVTAIACIVMALAWRNATALVLGSVAGAATVAILMWAGAPPPLPRLRRGPARDLLSYGLPASAAAISWVGFRNCDYAIIGARLGALQAGLYFRAYTLGVEYQKKVSQVMYSVGFPVLARTRTRREMNAVLGQMVRLLTLVLFPLLALLVIVGPEFVPWLFGRAWARAVVPMQILVVGGAATLVIDAAGSALMASGRPRALLGYGWAHFATYALAVLILSPLGLTAVAVGAAVVHTLFMVVAYLVLLHGSDERGLRRLCDDIAPATVSCAALAGVAFPAKLALLSAGASTIPFLGAEFVIAAIVYLLTLRIVFPASWRSLRTFVGQILPGHPLARLTHRVTPAGASPAT